MPAETANGRTARSTRDAITEREAAVAAAARAKACAELCELMFPSQFVSCMVAICSAGDLDQQLEEAGSRSPSLAASRSPSAYDVIAHAVKKWAPRVECFNTPECQHLSDRAMWHTCVSNHCRSRRET